MEPTQSWHAKMVAADHGGFTPNVTRSSDIAAFAALSAENIRRLFGQPSTALGKLPQLIVPRK